MRAVWRVARRELSAASADGRTLWTGALLLAVLALALTAGLSAARLEGAAVQRGQAGERARWVGQGSKDPHSAAHYGVYAFAPASPLAAFDPGVRPYSGRSVFLEAHHWNQPPTPETSSLLRLGQLGAAWALQLLLPLWLILLGFGALAGEREAGRLRFQLALGVEGRSLVLGKALAVALVAGAVALPVCVLGGLTLALASAGGLSWGRVGLLALAYGAYALIALAGTLAVSGRARRARTACALLLALWGADAVLLPRLASEASELWAPTPSGTELSTSLRERMERAFGPEGSFRRRWADQRRRLAAAYGVAPERLGREAAGLRLQLAEEVSGEIFAELYGELFLDYARQERLLQRAAWLSPGLALRQLSAALTGSDRAEHERFLVAAEAYRRELVGTLNRNLGRSGGSADHTLWERIPPFAYEPAPLRGALAGVGEAAWALLAWVGLALLAGALALRRLPDEERPPRPSPLRAGVRHEQRRLRRSPGARLALGAFLVAGGLAWAQGARREEQAHADYARLEASERARVAALESRVWAFQDGELREPGLEPLHPAVLGDGSGRPTIQPLPAPLLRLAQPDPAAPRSYRISTDRFAALEVARDLQNPSLRASGVFDLAFLFAFLQPLLVLVLCYDLIAGEREGGQWALVRAQPVSLRALLGQRLLVRGAWSLAPSLALLFLVALSSPHPSGAGWARLALWVVAIALHTCLWLLAAAWLGLRARTPAQSATALAGLWALLAVIAPAALSAGLGLALPETPQAAEVDARRAARAEADRTSARELSRYFADHPELANEGDRRGASLRFAIQRGVVRERVAGILAESEAAARARRAARDRLQRWLRRLSPTLACHELLVDAAGAGSPRARRFEAQARRFHGEWRELFLARIRRDELLEDLDAVPVFRYVEEPLDELLARTAPDLGLLLLAALALGGALWRRSGRAAST